MSNKKPHSSKPKQEELPDQAVPVQEPINEASGAEASGAEIQLATALASTQDELADSRETAAFAETELNRLTQALADAQLVISKQQNDAKNNPVVLRKTLNPDEIDDTRIDPRQFANNATRDNPFGDAVLIEPETADVESPQFMKRAAYAAFMQEPVTVHILETTEKNADGIFQVSINGKPIVFMRNEEKTIPRCYVEALATARPITYDCQEFTNPDGGFRDYRYPASRGSRYPFEVVRDDNKYGREWLKRVAKAA